MTVVFTTPPGPVPADLVVEFSCTTEPTSVSIKYAPAGVAGAWDVVYGRTDDDNANGVFSDGWAALASRSGANWTINPPSSAGWPCAFEVVIDEAPPPAPQPPSAEGGSDVAPYLSPNAWYLFDPARAGYDASGNGEYMAGQVASWTSGPKLGGSAAIGAQYNQSAYPRATWRVAGALTCMVLVDLASTTGQRWFAVCDTSAANTAWWGFGVTANNRCCYSVSNGSATATIEIGPALGNVGWALLTFVRAADGVSVSVYQDARLLGTGTAPYAAAGNAAAFLSVGKAASTTVTAHATALVGLYTRALTAEEVAGGSARIVGTKLIGVLTPALYSPVAQYALDVLAAGGVLRDRGPNAYHLDSINPASGYPRVTSLIPGKTVPFHNTWFTRSSFPNLTRRMTMTCRVYCTTILGSGSVGLIVNAGTGSSYTTILQRVANNELLTYNELSGSPGTGSGWACGLFVVPLKWCFIAARRRADGRMIITLDEHSVLSPIGVVTQPVGGVAGAVYINNNSYNSYNPNGATDDVSFWTTDLTDSQLEDVRASMGMVAT